LIGSFLGPLKNALKTRVDRQSRILGKNASWVFVANAVAVLSLFLQSVVLGRFLGPEIFGIYIMVTAVVETLQEVLNPNADVAVVRYVSEFRAHNQLDLIVAFLKLALIIVMAGGLLAMIIVGLLALTASSYILRNSELLPYVLLFAACRSVTLFDNVSMSLLRTFGRFRFNSIIRIVLSTVDLTVIVAVTMFFRPSVAHVLVAVSLTFLLGGCVRNGAAMIESRKFLWPHRSARVALLRSRLKEVVGFVVSNSLSRTIKTTTNRLDFVLLGTISGSASAVGIYAIAKKLANSIALVADPLLVSVYPQVAGLVTDGSWNELKTMLRRTTNGLLLLAVPLWIGVALTGRRLISALYGVEYVEAFGPLLILSASLFLAYCVFWAVPLLLSLGQPTARLRIDILGALLWLAVLVALVPGLEAVGSAIAYGCSVLLIHILYVWKGSRILKLASPTKPVSYEPV